jgi:hypothetical protein
LLSFVSESVEEALLNVLEYFEEIENDELTEDEFFDMYEKNMTEEQSKAVLDFIDEYKRSWYCSHPEGEGFDEMENEMQMACQWLMNQISKRWSQNELYEPRKKRS